MRYLPEYFDSNSLYWVIDSIIMISLAVYVFKNSEKNMLNLFIGFGLLNLLGYDYFNNINMLLNDVIAQNKMLGDMIRDRDVEIETLIEEIKKLKKNGENPYTDYLT